MPGTATPVPIEEHALLGNTRAAALVRPDGSITWACLPGVDSPALFASLLGRQEHGFWRVGPAGPQPRAAARRQYLRDTMVLRSEYDTGTGVLAVSDFMPAPTPAGDADAKIVRIVECVRGEVDAVSVYRPRVDYGARMPYIRHADQDGLHRLAANGHGETYWLSGAVRHSFEWDGVCRAHFTLRRGESVALTLTWKLAGRPAPLPSDALAQLDATVEFWERWARGCAYRGPDREAVVRSAVTIKALCHPRGGVLTAPTTSMPTLPEQLGGGRLRDQRFVRLRDSALAIASLVRLGFLDEARRWRGWLIENVDPHRLQSAYRANGDPELDEEVLDHLTGYEGSRPVRIGDASASRLQLDVLGEVVDTLLLAEDAGLPPTPQVDAWVLAVLAEIEDRWQAPDSGIREVQGESRDFTHAKIRYWIAVDRSLAMLERRTDPPAPLGWYRELRDAIHTDVCDNGYDPDRTTFTRYYGATKPDAALLLVPQAGFLPPDDARVIGTVEAAQRELSTESGLVLCDADGEEYGGEVASLAFSFRLVQALVAVGRSREARDLFDRLLALRGDLGLLAETYDTLAHGQLGNFPQTSSHQALIDAALSLAPPPQGAVPLRPRMRAGQAPSAAGAAR
ncbi:glycoside hydrolase family 15 protein [Kitasatospora sp. NPDC051984]|uniref:glycoside hydrolase family 15 protein n=1 Tax=Kitasatospora sp. NPDC051984 TaxID=3364059 RepID=UPI0037C6C164